MNQTKRPPYAYAHGGSDTLLPTELCFARKDEAVNAVPEPELRKITTVDIDPQASFIVGVETPPPGENLVETMRRLCPNDNKTPRELFEDAMESYYVFGNHDSYEKYLAAKDALARRSSDTRRFVAYGTAADLKRALDDDGAKVPYTILNAEGRARIADLYSTRVIRPSKRYQMPVDSSAVRTERICAKCEGKGSYLLLSPFPHTCTECGGNGKVSS